MVGVARDHLVDLVECVHLATEGGYLEQTQDHLQSQLNNVMLGRHPPGQVSQGLWEGRGGEGRGGEGREGEGREGSRYVHSTYIVCRRDSAYMIGTPHIS